ncbi:MAG: hypothetical protein U9R56_02380, partial [candidate division Zixibacteria bacterium]|nr:hypothetical protein [candidate division Zixibacteria bacterium]
TSRVDRKSDADSSNSLQVQTEYAYRPYPRITTTILNSGQVLHKIEQNLERPIESTEEQQRIEDIIKRQHAEVVKLLKQQDGYPSSTPKKAQETCDKPSAISDRLKLIPGIEYLFHLDNEGNFIGNASEKQFKKKYSAIFKYVPELMEIFSLLPGSGSQREQGVYEIEYDRLYFASVGDGCYFLTAKRVDRDTDYEKAIKEVLKAGS